MSEQPIGGGKPGRSGPPGNQNARKHGGTRVRLELKELVHRAVTDARTVESRDMVAWAGSVAADLGGVDNLSQQERTLLDLAARTKLQLDRIDGWLFRQPQLVNRRTRSLHPVVRERTALVTTLRGLLVDLGLKRRAREVASLAEYLAARANGHEPTAPPPVDTAAAPAAGDAADAPAAPAEKGEDRP